MAAKISKCKTVILDSECCDKTRYFSNFSNFPPAGGEKVLYVDESTGDIYIWDSESSEYIKSSSTPSTDCCCWAELAYNFEDTESDYGSIRLHTVCGESPDITWQFCGTGDTWVDLDPQPTPNNIFFILVGQGLYRVKIAANETYCCDTYSNAFPVFFY